MSTSSYFAEIRDPGARVRALCDYGCKVEVDATIPPKRYFRSGLEMIRMANVYYDEKNYESAFILYSKFISLFVEKLPKHPQYKSCSPSDRAVNKKKLLTVFGLAEELKKLLREKYQILEEKYKEEERKLLLAQQEQLRIQEEKERKERERLEAIAGAHIPKDDIPRAPLDLPNSIPNLPPEQQTRIPSASPEELYDIASILPEEQNKVPSVPPPTYDAATAPGYPVAVPSRDLKPNILESPISPSSPPLPAVGDSSHDGNAIGRPVVDRSCKPGLEHFTSTGYQGINKYGFKDVVVPSSLMVKFVNLALPNTTKNIETCGILAGKLAQGTFVITNLIIPNQSGTPDSCTTDNEEEMFDYQDEHDLITLGWIHTHPTQTAFMSSVDLHTHCSYQLMMPEAIAIVCSPKYQETGMFSLTPDYGLNFIANCSKTGFHPHPKDPPIYETSPHIRIDNAQAVEVADLRHNKFP